MGANLSWFYGGGGYLSFNNPKTGFGVLGNVGLDYKFEGIPINLAIDFKPEINFAPKVNPNFNTFGFAIRYVIN